MYRAVLRGGRIEWIDPPPTGDQPTPVHVTVVGTGSATGEAHGKAMARALEQLAGLGGITSISDPVKWQRTMRDERHLPGREL